MQQKKDLKQLFDDYIYECQFSSRLRPATLKGYKEAFEHFSNLMPEIKYPDSLNASIMNEFFERLQVRKRIVGKNTEVVGVKDSTVATYYSKLNCFFEWLRRKDLLMENPLKHIKPPEPKYDDHRALRKDEVEKIISAATVHAISNLMRSRDLAIISLFMFCGLRRGELIGLQVRDINMDSRILTVRAEISKSKRTRQIPISPCLFVALEDYFRVRKEKNYRTEYLIVSTTMDGPLTYDGFKHWVKRLIRLSGVKFHLHRFRHTFACALANQSSSSIKIQKLMGHTDLRMTERYLRSMGVEDMREDVNKLSLDKLM